MDIKTAAWAWDRLEGRALGHKILLYRQMGVCYILDKIKEENHYVKEAFCGNLFTGSY